MIFPLSKNEKLGFCKNGRLDFYLQSRIKKIEIFFKNLDQSTVIVENKGIKPNKFQLSGMVYYIESVYSISLIFGGLLFF